MSTVRMSAARRVAPIDHVGGAAAGAQGPAAAQALLERLPALGRLEDRIAAIAAQFPGRVAFSTSLGLEDQAVLHAIAGTGARIDVFTLGHRSPLPRDARDAGRERAALWHRDPRAGSRSRRGGGAGRA